MLITDSQAGRAFEVTRAGEIVWDFYNPDRRQGERAAIYRLTRLDPTATERLLHR